MNFTYIMFYDYIFEIFFNIDIYGERTGFSMRYLLP